MLSPALQTSPWLNYPLRFAILSEAGGKMNDVHALLAKQSLELIEGVVQSLSLTCWWFSQCAR